MQFHRTIRLFLEIHINKKAQVPIAIGTWAFLYSD